MLRSLLGAAELVTAAGFGRMQKSLAGLLAATALSALLGGCSTSPTMPDDPLEPVNRYIFDFNQSLDRNAAVPAATFYHSAIPNPVRTGVHNFISNLSEPVTFVNDLLQADLSRAGDTVARFGINTTAGVGGLIDFATDEGFPDYPEDFGLTLGKYGVPPGPYFVLPLLGPEDVRDLAGRFVDSFFVPTRYFHYQYAGKASVSLGLSAMSLLDQRSQNVGILRDIERSSVDYYATTRSVYLQRREDRVNDGAPVVENLPNY